MFCIATATAVVSLSVLPAAAGPSNAAKCESAKLKESGKLASCLLKEESKAANKGEAVDAEKTARCGEKFTAKVDGAETKAAGECPTTGDGAAIADAVAGLTNHITQSVSGVRFVDNGDGTVTDTQTGTIWAQKVAGLGCTHCDDERSWQDTQIWLAELNRDAFADRDGWGLPTAEELQEILECETVGAVTTCATDPTFGPSSSIAPTWTGLAGLAVGTIQVVGE